MARKGRGGQKMKITKTNPETKIYMMERETQQGSNAEVARYRIVVQHLHLGYRSGTSYPAGVCICDMNIRNFSAHVGYPSAISI